MNIDKLQEKLEGSSPGAERGFEAVCDDGEQTLYSKPDGCESFDMYMERAKEPEVAALSEDESGWLNCQDAPLPKREEEIFLQERPYPRLSGVNHCTGCAGALMGRA